MNWINNETKQQMLSLVYFISQGMKLMKRICETSAMKGYLLLFKHFRHDKHRHEYRRQNQYERITNVIMNGSKLYVHSQITIKEVASQYL